MEMDIFQAEMGVMAQEAPEIEKALGVGNLPLLLISTDFVLDALDILIEESYWLVRDTATGLWNLAKPIRRTPTFKKVAAASSKAANATKNVALKGW